MKRIITLAIFVLSSCFWVNAGTDGGTKENKSEISNKLTWWEDAKFGMFIHWGLYSKTAGYWKDRKATGFEHFMLYERIPWKEYATIADDFNPVNYNAEEWVLTAKNAGMKYLVITAKHHDGFALYNSPSSDYDIVDCTPYAKDPMKELAAACHKHGIRLGFYYSLGRDWQDPDVPTNWPVKGGRSNTWDYPDEDKKVFNKYFERKVKPQVRELLTQYGKVDVLWFDTPGLISEAESEELRNFILTIQPECIINSRIGNGKGDYNVHEQNIVQKGDTSLWESCITMSRNWGFVEYDTAYKSPELMVRQLLEIVSKGGNFLLNNGPTAKGDMTEQTLISLEKIGEWMKLNAEGVYGTQPWHVANERLDNKISEHTLQKHDDKNTMKDAVNDATSKQIFPEVRFTSKGNNVYAYVCSPVSSEVCIKALVAGKVSEIEDVEMLGTSKKIKWKQSKEGLILEVSDNPIEEVPVIGFRIRFSKSNG
ncbi:alpha-L-fucosidase [uncultured Sunxiuqinia sp.]|uniref:alpha-L-fucosidase n=1 Tax=uncultured Sunxiuqinia sp. TaxID=1573825 RepID=UPI00262DC087|nr:alpha-L-fucosidase [uncultured Sunxiuqinia sp.]